MTNISARISRSLVTVIFLTLIQVIAGPILVPQISTPNAQATTAGITTDGLVLDWNATDSADRAIASGVVPTYTTTGGGYYDLNGSTQYIYPDASTTIGNVGGVRYLSVFMWVYPKGAGQLLTQQDNKTLNCCYHTAIMEYTSADQLYIGLWNGGDQTAVNLSTTIATPKNNWYLVGLVYDGTKINGYINGVFAGSTSNFAYSPPGSAFYGIGANDLTNIIVPESKGNMRVGSLYVYNKALSAADASANFAATTGRFGPTVSNPSNASTFVNRTATFTSSSCTNTTSGSATCNYGWQVSTDSGSTWSFIPGATSSTYTTPILTSAYNNYRYRMYAWDPGTGATTAADLYAITSPATLTVTTPPGSDTDSALSLNGSSQYAEISDTTGSPFDTSGTFTIQAWVNPATGCASAQTVIAKYLSYMLECYNGYWWYMNIANGSTGSDAATLIKVEQDEWHHIALARSAGSQNLNFYYDGILVQTLSTGVTNMTPNNQPFRIGQYNNNYFFNGQIDEVRIYNSQRTQTQIVQDMNSYGNVNDSELMVYYDFNEFTGSKLYNRKAGATSGSDLDILNSPLWKDVKIVDPLSLPVYTIVKFPRSYLTVNGGWRVPAGATRVSALVVAGGGGGGSRAAGGGGAGGLVYRQTLTLSAGSVESITVGHGGLGGYSMPTFTNRQGLNGGDSQLGTHTGALGGGGGGGAGDAGNTYRVGLNGGSGGGASGDAAGGGSSAAFGIGQQSSSKGYGLGNNGGSGMSGTYWNGGGGGGSGGAGQNASTTSWVAGNGGAGTLDPVGGSNLCLAAGGGGGTINTGTSAGAGGTCVSGNVTAGAGTVGAVIAGSATANSGSGGGGSGYQSTDVGGGHGGSGVIIIRWITATKPAFTPPVIAYLNAGMTETFTTNVAADSATVTLTRTFRWESSTTGPTGTYSVIKQGTGANNAFFSWVPQDTATSGSNFSYRVIVTDSDTAGLFIVETSTPVHAIINRPLSVTGSSTIRKAINVTRNENFSISLGTSTYRSTLLPVIPGITLDTSTAGLAIIRIADTATVGTFYETLTVTDSVSAVVTMPLTIIVSAPPSLVNSGDEVLNGQIFNFDPANSASFNRATNAYSDISGSKRPITAVNGPTFNDDSSGFISFSRTSNQYLSATGFGRLEKFTIETYVRLDSITADTCILTTEYAASAVGYALCIDSTRTVFVGFYSVDWTFKRTSQTLTLGQWTHIVGTFDGTDVNLYFDGVSAPVLNSSQNAGLIPPAPNTDRIYIGKYWTTASVSGASISLGYIRLYNLGFTLPDVTKNFNATKDRFTVGNLNQIKPTQKYGAVTAETFTVTSGSETRTVGLAVGNRTGIRWDTSTAGLVRLNVQESITPGIYYDTITVTDNLAQSTNLPIKFTIAKADSITVTLRNPKTLVYTGNSASSLPDIGIIGLVSSDTGTAQRRYSAPASGVGATETYTALVNGTSVPIDVETYTVSAATPVLTVGSLSNYEGVIYETSTLMITKATQPALMINYFGAVAGSSYTLIPSGGAGTGVFTETITAGSSALNCTLNNKVLANSSPADEQRFCNVLITRAASRNYFMETLTASIYFLVFAINQPTQSGSGATIGITGATGFVTDPNAAPSITSLSTTTLSLSSGGNFTITGAGFGLSQLTVKFWRNKSILVTSTNGTTLVIPIASIAAAGATTGRILVINANGTATSTEILTITS